MCFRPDISTIIYLKYKVFSFTNILKPIKNVAYLIATARCWCGLHIFMLVFPLQPLRIISITTHLNWHLIFLNGRFLHLIWLQQSTKILLLQVDYLYGAYLDIYCFRSHNPLTHLKDRVPLNCYQHVWTII